MNENIKVAVLGGGQGAHAITADLTLRGCSVNMCELPAFAKSIEPLRESGTIEISGQIQGLAKPNLITTDPRKALEDVTVVFLAVPSYAQRPFVELIKPHLRDGMTLVLVPGNFGSLAAARALGTRVLEGKILLAETSSLPYFARLLAPGEVNITFRTPVMLAAFPGKFTQRVVDRVKPLYETTAALRDILEASLCNFNMLGHPAGTLLNSGAIEFAEMNGREYFMYAEGCSPAVARAIGAVDEERCRVAKEFGYQLTPLVEILYSLGFSDEPSIFKGLQSPILTPGAGPSGLKHRYLTEDIPYLFVPLGELARLANVDIPVVDALTTIACVLNETDYRREGLTLKALGLDDLTIPRMRQFLAEGVRPESGRKVDAAENRAR